MLNIVVLDDRRKEVKNNDSFFVKDILLYAYKKMKLHEDYEMSVNFINDKEIRKINRQYRHVDRATDVISFALEETDKINIKGFPKELGDLFVSLDHAYQQAHELKHSFQRELGYMVVHGFLHLLGYDHTKSTRDEKIMFGIQRKILEGYGLEG